MQESGPRQNGVENSRRRKIPFEVIAAILLGLATLASAWSGYQSSLWNGIQIFRLADANNASRQASEQDIYANQLRVVDATMFERYLVARHSGDMELAEFLFVRFRPEARRAIEAWLATQPLKNPAAPLTPFVMDEYELQAETDARRLRELENRMYVQARQANGTSDAYLLYTVLYGIVLFLAGIAAAFKDARLRTAVLIAAAAVMVATSAAMAFMPLAAE